MASISVWRVLDLTQGSDGESLTKLWMLLSFSIENMKPNKNVYLFIVSPWLTLLALILLQLQRG